MVNSISKEIDFERADLMEDIKFGVNRIRKLKIEHAKIKTTVGKSKYSINSPPEIFIRKAIDSSESEDEGPRYIKNEYKNGKNGKHYTNGDKRRNKKARILDEDFPTL